MTTEVRPVRGRESVLVKRMLDAHVEIAALKAEGRQMGRLVPLARYVHNYVAASADDIRAEQAAGVIVLSLERMARRHPDPAA